MAPPTTRRPRAHHRVNPYPGARRQNETKMCSDYDEMSPSIAATFLFDSARCEKEQNVIISDCPVHNNNFIFQSSLYRAYF